MLHGIGSGYAEAEAFRSAEVKISKILRSGYASEAYIYIYIYVYIYIVAKNTYIYLYIMEKKPKPYLN